MIRVVVALACLLAVVVAGPAHAGYPPASTATVVLTMPDGSQLRAAVGGEEDELCVSVVDPADVDGELTCPFGFFDGHPDYDAWASDAVGVRDFGAATSVGGATAPTVASVEYTVRGGRRVRIPTVPAPAHLHGRLATARYFAAPVPDVPATRRLYAADGTLLRTDDDLELNVSYDRQPTGGGTRLLRGRGWTLTVTAKQQAAPIRGDAAHAIPLLCAAVRGRDSDDLCTLVEAPFTQVATAPACTPQGRAVVFGLIPRSVAAPRVALLADGRRARVRSRAVPVRFGAPGVRAFALVLPPGVGLRGFDRGPAAHARPSALSGGCGSSQATAFAIERDGGRGAPVGGDAVVAAPDAPRLFVADDDAALCLSLDAPTRGGDCAPPSPLIGAVDLALDPRRDVVGGAVDARVPAVRVTLASGRSVNVPTLAPAPYAGRFAPHIRVFAYRAPGGATITKVAPLDPRGRALEALPLDVEGDPDDPFGAIADARVLLRAPGGARIATARWRTGQYMTMPCVFVARGALPRDGAPCPSFDPWGGGFGELTGHADCRARIVLLSGSVSRRITGIRARLAGGGTAPGQVRRAAGGRVAVLVPPRERSVTRVELLGFRGRVVRRFAARIPAATAQCGYGSFGLFRELGDVDLR